MKRMTKGQIIEARIVLIEQQQKIYMAGGLDYLPPEYFTNESELDELYDQLDELQGVQ